MATMAWAPSSELVERYRADGLTRYSHAEIVAALEAWDAAQARYDAAVARAAVIVVPERDTLGRCYPDTPEAVRLLNDLLDSNLIPCGPSYQKRGETWRVREWQTATRRLARLTATIECAIDATR